jgi:hypothetical protein
MNEFVPISDEAPHLVSSRCGAILVTKYCSRPAILLICARAARQRKTGEGRRWCPGAELNHRHTDFQSVALPTELPGRLARGAYRGDGACLSSRALRGWLSNSRRAIVRHEKFLLTQFMFCSKSNFIK